MITQRIENFFKPFIKRPKLYLLLILAITLFWGNYSIRLSYDNSYKNTLIPTEESSFYKNKFINIFGSEEAIFIVFRVPDEINLKLLNIIEEITNQIERLPNIDYVLSLNNAYIFVRDENNKLKRVQVKEAITSYNISIDEVKSQIISSPLYKETLISKDLSYVSIILYPELLAGTCSKNDKILNPIKNEILKNASEKYGIQFHLGGVPLICSSVFGYIEGEGKNYILYASLIAIILIYLFFRFEGLLFTILTIIISISWTFGLFYIFKDNITWTIAILPSVLIVITTSNVTYIYIHFEREKSKFIDKKQALIRTIRFMITPLFVASLATMAGFIPLIISSMSTIRELGFLSIYGILCSYIFSFIIFAVIIPLFKNGTPQNDISYIKTYFPYKISSFLYDYIMTNKLIIISIMLLVIFPFSFIGILKIDMKTNPLFFFGNTSKLVKDTEIVEKNFGGIVNFMIMFEDKQGDIEKNPHLIEEIKKFENYLHNNVKSLFNSQKFSTLSIVDIIEDPLLKSDKSINNINEILALYQQNNDKFFNRIFNANFSTACIIGRFSAVEFDLSESTNNIFAPIRNYIKTYFDKSPFNVRLVGVATLTGDTNRYMIKSQIEIFIMACIIIFLLISSLFSSWKLGFFSLIPIIFSVVITFGIMGWGKITLNLATSLVVYIAIGTIVDDVIHFLSRFRKEFAVDLDYEKALLRTFSYIAEPLIIASTILIIGAITFCFSYFQPLYELGALFALTIFASLLGNLILLPVLIMILQPININDAIKMKLMIL